MLYFVVLCNSNAIFNVSLQLNFLATINYSIAKYFIELVHYTIYNNVQDE